MISLRIRRLTPTAILPTRGSPEAIGLDLYYDGNAVQMVPGARGVFKAGVAVAIPAGRYGRVAPRSGLAVKFGLCVMAGVIDADYRGEVCVVLINLGDEIIQVNPGDRIAQLIMERADILPVLEVSDLDDTVRGAGGFGSTDDDGSSAAEPAQDRAVDPLVDDGSVAAW